MSHFLSLSDETSFEAGIKVQIHTQDEPPFIDQLGFGVAPGFQTFVSCQEQRVPNDCSFSQFLSCWTRLKAHRTPIVPVCCFSAWFWFLQMLVFIHLFVLFFNALM